MRCDLELGTISAVVEVATLTSTSPFLCSGSGAPCTWSIHFLKWKSYNNVLCSWSLGSLFWISKHTLWTWRLIKRPSCPNLEVEYECFIDLGAQTVLQTWWTYSTLSYIHQSEDIEIDTPWKDSQYKSLQLSTKWEKARGNSICSSPDWCLCSNSAPEPFAHSPWWFA